MISFRTISNAYSSGFGINVINVSLIWVSFYAVKKPCEILVEYLCLKVFGLGKPSYIFSRTVIIKITAMLNFMKETACLYPLQDPSLQFLLKSLSIIFILKTFVGYRCYFQ